MFVRHKVRIRTILRFSYANLGLALCNNPGIAQKTSYAVPSPQASLLAVASHGHKLSPHLLFGLVGGNRMEWEATYTHTQTLPLFLSLSLTLSLTHTQHTPYTLSLTHTGAFRPVDSMDDFCQECSSGDYQDESGQTHCLKCPKDYYCPVIEHTQILNRILNILCVPLRQLITL